MSKLTKEDVFFGFAVTLGSLFAAALLWHLLIVNHQRNVERDKFYAEHCQAVTDAGLLGKTYRCVEPPHN